MCDKNRNLGLVKEFSILLFTLWYAFIYFFLSFQQFLLKAFLFILQTFHTFSGCTLIIFVYLYLCPSLPRVPHPDLLQYMSQFLVINSSLSHVSVFILRGVWIHPLGTDNLPTGTFPKEINDPSSATIKYQQLLKHVSLSKETQVFYFLLTIHKMYSDCDFTSPFSTQITPPPHTSTPVLPFALSLENNRTNEKANK